MLYVRNKANMAGKERKLFGKISTFVLDKIFSAICGVGAAALSYVFLDFSSVVVRYYDPLYSFFYSNAITCGAIFLFSLAFTWCVWRRPNLSIFYYLVGGVLLGVSALMEKGHIDGNVDTQFVISFSGFLLACEGMLLHLVKIILDIFRGSPSE